MFTEDKGTETIDGTKYYTFQPNTIVYAVPVDSDLGKIMNSAKIGVVWHTTYTGSTSSRYESIIWCRYKRIKKPSSVWMDDATYKDVSGRATMTSKRNCNVTASSIKYVGKTFQRINSVRLKKFLVVTGWYLTGKL